MLMSDGSWQGYVNDGDIAATLKANSFDFFGDTTSQGGTRPKGMDSRPNLEILDASKRKEHP